MRVSNIPLLGKIYTIISDSVSEIIGFVVIQLSQVSFVFLNNRRSGSAMAPVTAANSRPSTTEPIRY